MALKAISEDSPKSRLSSVLAKVFFRLRQVRWRKKRINRDWYMIFGDWGLGTGELGAPSGDKG
ncbi:hypothetical protein FDUTEX481_01424 [Tolypothrix sp. PCC 7601]|nr:hypothetical protein FDUTEX481_01424 [Tolypothrix sp. PCC 7601]